MLLKGGNMDTQQTKHTIISALQDKILQWQGLDTIQHSNNQVGLGKIEGAFPKGIFPTGAVHEFLCSNDEGEAASSGFMTVLLSKLLRDKGLCLWIGSSDRLFAPSLGLFGVDPHRIIFVQMKSKKHMLWATEESLKCKGIKVVVAELEYLDFKQSRRLQLAVEKSKATGFILRKTEESPGSTACVARWHIRPLASAVEAGLPGVGHPRWEVSFLKVRHGEPSVWLAEWSGNKVLSTQQKEAFVSKEEHPERKAI